jgi:formylglycine-generating enzyme
VKHQLKCLLIGLALIAGVYQTFGQAVINSFSQNGVLTCSGLQTGTVATVQWASSLSGPWQTNWAGLAAVTVSNNGTITVSVPMFYRVLAVTNPPTFTSDGMALIPAGTFTMGDVTDTNLYGDAAPTNVYVSAFYMDTNLVSYNQWQAVYGYATSQGYSFTNAGAGKAGNHPVQTLDWYDCVKWCNGRSQQAGLTPVYYTDAYFTQVYTNGEPALVYQQLANNGYRLPTEAEWEKAARGGLSGQRFPWGNTISENQANYYSSANYFYDLSDTGFNPIYATGAYPYTSPVGSFAPNGYGLYDMAGNVEEYCWDWYATPYGQPSNTNPTGPVGPLGNHVLRGGGWDDHAIDSHCAYRDHADYPSNPDGGDFGFRCVRGL